MKTPTSIRAMTSRAVPVQPRKASKVSRILIAHTGVRVQALSTAARGATDTALSHLNRLSTVLPNESCESAAARMSVNVLLLCAKSMEIAGAWNGSLRTSTHRVGVMRAIVEIAGAVQSMWSHPPPPSILTPPPARTPAAAPLRGPPAGAGPRRRSGRWPQTRCPALGAGRGPCSSPAPACPHG